jgi:hypothetical protein
VVPSVRRQRDGDRWAQCEGGKTLRGVVREEEAAFAGGRRRLGLMNFFLSETVKPYAQVSFLIREKYGYQIFFSKGTWPVLILRVKYPISLTCF